MRSVCWYVMAGIRIPAGFHKNNEHLLFVIFFSTRKTREHELVKMKPGESRRAVRMLDRTLCAIKVKAGTHQEEGGGEKTPTWYL